ncbi:VanZ family protein [Marinoscillum furvescens]|uniref:VanZ like protein n=1 Tax=Marinoscillum furvescens DSM 4134 TaxID=1122208 RepID=A0A3D9LH93_MARFU|nr:VanZ family protein [Marinoscillum furvescens]REE05978.1 VanZ like protein [Marinoscillum furvescens DSM 4134]
MLKIIKNSLVNNIRKLQPYLLATTVLWTALILYLLLMPGEFVRGPRWFRGEDKVAHFALFAMWSCQVYLVLDQRLRKEISTLLAVLGGAVFFGIATEMLQTLMPRRAGDVQDFLADMIGAVIGLTVAYFLKKELICMENKLDK